MTESTNSPNGTETKNNWENPFKGMKIADNSILSTLEGRSSCMKCGKSRKFFCYTCYIPVPELVSEVPYIKLPIKIDIIKHKNEIDGKSTAIHASILAPDDINIFTYPNIPDYKNEEGVVLIFPSPTSVNISSLFGGDFQLDIKENYGLPKGTHMGTLLRFRLQEIVKEKEQLDEMNALSLDMIIKTKYDLTNLPVKKAIFIDSTWNQSRGIYKDERISSLKSVVLQNRLSQFWRHQRGSLRWYLATIEAIHQFFLEVHMNAFGLDQNYTGIDNLKLSIDCIPPDKIINTAENCDNEATAPYNGQYDNLLFFFSYMYDLIHTYYDHQNLKSYKRPFI